MKSKEILEAETKEIIGKNTELTILLSASQKKKIDSNHSWKGNKDDELICT